MASAFKLISAAALGALGLAPQSVAAVHQDNGGTNAGGGSGTNSGGGSSNNGSSGSNTGTGHN